MVECILDKLKIAVDNHDKWYFMSDDNRYYLRGLHSRQEIEKLYKLCVENNLKESADVIMEKIDV